MSILNSVEVTANIAGKDYHFISLILKQTFNEHHTFEIVLDYEALEKVWMDNPFPTIKMIGEPVTFVMKHKVSGESNYFEGIITDVSFQGTNGSQNSILISGTSPTILLDAQKTMNSFVDKNVAQIVKEVVEDAGNGAKIEIDPFNTDTLNYLCQYNETIFELLNRLSWEYGERFYYTGTKIYFGKQMLHNAFDITYDSELTFFNLRAKLIPSKFNRYHYLIDNDHETNSPSPNSNGIRGVRGYLQAALDKADEVYTFAGAILPARGYVGDKGKLDAIATAEKSRQVAEGLVFEGRSQTCKIQIGMPINIKLPKHMKVTHEDIETFLITLVTHKVSQDGYYSNEFTGVLDGIENIPMIPIPPLNTGAEIATVMDNSDELGRIKVQFQWQKGVNKSTNWIRVQTPDGGQSEKVTNNRGSVFIPEIGDRVMVGFEYGNPDRPFSMGSIFSQAVSKGGGENNAVKSIVTRSGIKITFDDDKKSLILKDPSGNTINMDGKGNISISAPNTITMSATNIKPNADNALDLKSEPAKEGKGEGTISIKSKKSIESETETEGISFIAEQTFSIESKSADLTLKASTDFRVDASDIEIESTGNLNITSSDTNIM